MANKDTAFLILVFVSLIVISYLADRLERTSMIDKIEAYLSKLSEEDRIELQKIREFVISLSPQFVEAMVYGVPGFKFKKKSLCCYAAFKNHLGFYPLSEDIITTFKEELKDFETAKGTVRFTPDHLIPLELIRNMIFARADEIENN